MLTFDILLRSIQSFAQDLIKFCEKTTVIINIIIVVGKEADPISDTFGGNQDTQ